MKDELNNLIEQFYKEQNEQKKAEILTSINHLTNEQYACGIDSNGNYSLFKIIASKKPNEELYRI